MAEPDQPQAAAANAVPARRRARNRPNRPHQDQHADDQPIGDGDFAVEIADGGDPDDVYVFEASDGDGQSITLGTKAPPAWARILVEIRESPGTPFAGLWKSNSDAVRWCIAYGIRRLTGLMHEYDQQEHRTDVINAQAFSYRTSGTLVQQAELIAKVADDVTKLARATEVMIGIGQRQAAVELVMRYLAGAHGQRSELWRTIFFRLLIDNESMAMSLGVMIAAGDLVDDLVEQALAERGAAPVDDRAVIHLDDRRRAAAGGGGGNRQ